MNGRFCFQSEIDLIKALDGCRNQTTPGDLKLEDYKGMRVAVVRIGFPMEEAYANPAGDV